MCLRARFARCRTTRQSPVLASASQTLLLELVVDLLGALLTFDKRHTQCFPVFGANTQVSSPRVHFQHHFLVFVCHYLSRSLSLFVSLSLYNLVVVVPTASVVGRLGDL